MNKKNTNMTKEEILQKIADCFDKEKNNKARNSMAVPVCSCDKPEFVKDTFIGIIFCNKCAKDKEQTDY